MANEFRNRGEQLVALEQKMSAFESRLTAVENSKADQTSVDLKISQLMYRAMVYLVIIVVVALILIAMFPEQILGFVVKLRG